MKLCICQVTSSTWHVSLYQVSLKLSFKDDLEIAEEWADRCLKMADKVEDAGKRRYLVARALCVLSALNRNMKKFGKAQNHIDCARQVRTISFMRYRSLICSALCRTKYKCALCFINVDVVA